jgi:hypothetical protein
MKIALWVVCLLLFGFWTGGALLLAELTDWTARQLASGGTAAMGQVLADWPIPAWAAVWVDAAWIEAAQSALSAALQGLEGSLPMLGSLVGWIKPVIWVMWGLGVVVLMLLAGGGHLLLGRMRPAVAHGA